MAEPLKSFFSPALVRRLASDASRVHPRFASRAFVKAATTGLDDLELLDRGKHIMAALTTYLPSTYPAAIEVLLQSLGGNATPTAMGYAGRVARSPPGTGGRVSGPPLSQFFRRRIS